MDIIQRHNYKIFFVLKKIVHIFDSEFMKSLKKSIMAKQLDESVRNGGFKAPSYKSPVDKKGGMASKAMKKPVAIKRGQVKK